MGKTKDVEDTEIEVARLVNKPIITADDGERKESMKNKDIWATTTTSNVFNLLEKCGIETHFLKQDSPNSLLVMKCNMIPAEVVIRRKIGEKSSYLKRNPEILPGTIFDNPVVELFLKDDERNDPIIIIEEGSWNIYDAKKPISKESFLGNTECFCLDFEIEKIEDTARTVFLILEQALAMLDITLEDLKVEFGRLRLTTSQGEIILADVIDNDSWRITKNGEDISKQKFRDGESEKAVADVYEIVANLSKLFPGLAGKIKISI